MSQRIEGFDLARAIAMLVMVLVNFKVAMLSGAVADNGFGLDLLDGRAAAVFVTLAGIGLSLLSSKTRLSGSAERQQQVRRQVLRRAAFLFIVGLGFVTVWPADILHYYGVMLALASLMLFWRGSLLLGLALVVVLAFPFSLWLGVDYNAGWHWPSLTYPEFWSWAGFSRNLWLNGFHPLLPWFSFLLLGLWLGRLNWQHKAVQWRLLLAGGGLALLAEVLARFCTDPLWSAWLGQTSPMPPLPLYVCSAMGSTLIWLVLAVKVAVLFHFAVARPVVRKTCCAVFCSGSSPLGVGLPGCALGVGGVGWVVGGGGGGVFFAGCWGGGGGGVRPLVVLWGGFRWLGSAWWVGVSPVGGVGCQRGGFGVGGVGGGGGSLGGGVGGWVGGGFPGATGGGGGWGAGPGRAALIVSGRVSGLRGGGGCRRVPRGGFLGGRPGRSLVPPRRGGGWENAMSLRGYQLTGNSIDQN
ncbi:MAG: heparan-alpha-glucosaminide N-acetyltransferase domain-containing protein [Rheinheimera sp.]|nr:heparan-alpha-glucosaminide N-acetyltransferase domain-containing protein [Rheinheimera sp.]